MLQDAPQVHESPVPEPLQVQYRRRDNTGAAGHRPRIAQRLDQPGQRKCLSLEERQIQDSNQKEEEARRRSRGGAHCVWAHQIIEIAQRVQKPRV